MPSDTGFGPITDACIHHAWSSQAEVMQYMSRGWQEYLGGPLPPALPPGEKRGLGLIQAHPWRVFTNPLGDKLPDSFPESGGAPGSDLSLLSRQHLDPGGITRAVLSHDVAALAPALPNHHLASAVVRATNDWCIDRWLDGRDGRLYGLVLVANEVPVEAAEEIRRAGRHDRMVGILMMGNGLGKAFGHPAYHPIYDAAVDMALPLVIMAGGDNAPDSLTAPVSGGSPATYSEYHVFRDQCLVTHLISLAAQGVFEKYPTLKVLLVGGGVAWIPSTMWRLDMAVKNLRRESPWIRRLPSEHVRERVRFATYPLETPAEPDRLVRMLRTFPGIEDLLVYASGYPDWDTDRPGEIAERLPEDWRRKVLNDNADGFFRWTGPAPAAVPKNAVGI